MTLCLDDLAGCEESLQEEQAMTWNEALKMVLGHLDLFLAGESDRIALGRCPLCLVGLFHARSIFTVYSYWWRTTCVWCPLYRWRLGEDDEGCDVPFNCMDLVVHHLKRVDGNSTTAREVREPMDLETNREDVQALRDHVARIASLYSPGTDWSQDFKVEKGLT